MHGCGVFTWPSRKRYEGSFIRNKFDGKGEIRDVDGTVQKGEFADGEMLDSKK